MEELLDDRNVTESVPLASPRQVKASLPVSPTAAANVRRGRGAIRDVLHGRDEQRLVVVVGPCSIHDRRAAFEYATRLKHLADQVSDSLVVIMRTYFEKPRTTVGWKGLINDPHLDGSCDIEAGLRLAREVLLEINDMGMPCAGEMLDPITPQYVGDLISWAAIGARTTESQTHRELASGLSMPVGFKNGTDGGLDVALNAMISSRQPHSFLGINVEGGAALVRTSGNPDRHIVLRGGSRGTNFDAASVLHATAMVRGEGIARPIMVDCSHDNSAKDHTRQVGVARIVGEQFCSGEQSIMGLLIESHLEAGKQTWKPDQPGRYGVSITDACIGWDDTEALLLELAAGVGARPRRAA